MLGDILFALRKMFQEIFYLGFAQGIKFYLLFKLGV